MRKRNLLMLILASAGMLVLIFDGKTAVLGIQSGIEICLRTLIPSLFPFFIFSGLLTASVSGQHIAGFRHIGKFCRIPEGSESLLAVGMLGGYPVGAKNVWDSYSRKQLTSDDAQRMAIFCNNAGPSFIFGVLGPLFPDRRWVWALWLIQIGGAVLTGMILPGGGGSRTILPQQETAGITEILSRSLKSMGLVCGWVVLFRMILEFLNRWVFWLFPAPVQVLLTGFLELSNGCIALHQITQTPLRFLLASVMLSTGGICILLQTGSVFPELNIKKYLAGKLLQCIIGIALTVAAIPILKGNTFNFAQGIVVIIFLTGVLSVLISRKRKKEVAIP